MEALQLFQLQNKVYLLQTGNAVNVDLKAARSEARNYKDRLTRKAFAQL